jgi:hypothetical protein
MTSHPAVFFSELTNDRLNVIASGLLDMRFETVREMNSPYDDNYTRETAIFGRSKNMLIDLAMKGKYDWLSLKHAGMDITFNISRVPCRFFRDDPENPEKSGFFKRNAVDDLFSPDENTPVMWRFVVEKALTDEDEDGVSFVGYNAYQEKVSEWTYQLGSSPIHSIDKVTPTATEIPPAVVEVRESAVEDVEVKNGTDKK